MYVIIIIMPLVSFIVNSILGRKIGKKGSIRITIILISISVIMAYIGAYEIIISGSEVSIKIRRWLISVEWSIKYDKITIIMCIIVLTVSISVIMYTSKYMERDIFQQRFNGYLSIFIFNMLIVVTSNNYLVMFIGWEMVGLASYLLINFWYNRIEANQAAFKAIIMNRIGDWGVIVFIISIMRINPTLEIGMIVNKESSEMFTIISIFLIIGAMGKSAQIGLHNWLPLSMEGPTPVSALLHAATLVTAGVYIIIRSMEYMTDISLMIIIIIASSTTILAALMGLLVNDIKKVIAYSTCSQLGYMFIAIGLKQESMGLFHLLNHAYFKALLFLSAGAIIHGLNDEQDMRKMGGLISYMPWTFTMNLIGSLALIAIPYISGYYSKELILDYAYQNTENLSINLLITKKWAYWIGTMTVIITTIYTIGTIMRIYIGIPRNTSIKVINGVEETPIMMTIPLIILGINSIYIGYLLKDMNKPVVYDFEMIKSNINIWIPTIVTIVTIIIIMNIKNISIKNKDFSGNINNNLIIKGVLNISMKIMKNLDQGIINPGKLMRLDTGTSLDKGVIQIYMYQILLGIVITISLTQK